MTQGQRHFTAWTLLSVGARGCAQTSRRPRSSLPIACSILVGGDSGLVRRDGGRAFRTPSPRCRRSSPGSSERGARLVGSVDDDLFVTGQPASLPYSIYVLYDVDELGPVVQLVHELRASELRRLLRVEARIGRPLFLLDN